MAARTTVNISRATRDLLGRCETLLDALPEPQRSNVRFIGCLTGGSVPDPNKKGIPAGEVLHFALATLESNLDPKAQSLRDVSDLAYQDYVRRLKDGHKVTDVDPDDPNEIRKMG